MAIRESSTHESNEGSARHRHAGWLLLALIVAGVTLAKLHLIASGPDLDSDAYGHALAGRKMLMDFTDLTVHWVWLPFLHGIYASTTALGLHPNVVRVLSVAASSASPVLLALALRRHSVSLPPSNNPRFLAFEPHLPWIAGSLLAIEPLSFAMGECGQTESFFQLAIVAGAFAFDRRTYWLSGLAFGIAAALRFEGWALLPVLLLLSLREGSNRLRAAASWAIPGVLVALWCLLQYRSTGVFLGFFRVNRDFVQGYFQDVGYPWGPHPQRLWMILWYGLLIPASQMFGPAYALTFTSAGWMNTRAPRSLWWTGVALLVIVTAGFVSGSHLGLARHAVVLAPLFAVALAAGLGQTATWAHRRFDRLQQWPQDTVVRAGALLVLACVVAPGTARVYLKRRKEHATAFASQAAAARSLCQEASNVTVIFCDNVGVEVLSALPPALFARFDPDLKEPRLPWSYETHRAALAVTTQQRASHTSPQWHVAWSDPNLVVLRFVPTAQ